MQHENTSVKTFTVKEANSLIPAIKSMLERAFYLNQKTKSLAGDMGNLVSIWGNDVMEKDHMDNEYYLFMTSQHQETINELVKTVKEIQAFGCIVKDLDSGLIDFYHESKGTVVLLCWKYGEDKIKYWHPVDGGFRSRIDIGQL